MWEQVWQRDSWLEILCRYLVSKRDDKKQLVGMIFPRYHQLDATRQLPEEGGPEHYAMRNRDALVAGQPDVFARVEDKWSALLKEIKARA